MGLCLYVRLFAAQPSPTHPTHRLWPCIILWYIQVYNKIYMYSIFSIIKRNCRQCVISHAIAFKCFFSVSLSLSRSIIFSFSLAVCICIKILLYRRIYETDPSHSFSMRCGWSLVEGLATCSYSSSGECSSLII